MRQALTFGLMLCVMMSAQDAAAQGPGRPKQQPRPTPQATTPPPTSATAVTVSDGGVTQGSLPVFRQFGTWLNDASAAGRGSGWTSIGAGYWRIPGGSQIDVPILNLAYGVANRVQLAATVPFYRVDYLGYTASGLDDMYFSAKLVAVDPTTGDGNVGFAVSPLIEVLSAGSTDGRRFHWALPVSAEVRANAVRLYGSAGYFSRGAVFTGGALEWTSPGGTMLTGALTQSLSTSDVDESVAPASRNRVDAVCAVAQPLSDRVAGFASIGRTLTTIDEGGTSLSLTGGVSIGF
jgi:hypothetical protein